MEYEIKEALIHDCAQSACLAGLTARHGLAACGCSARCGEQSASNSSAELSGRSPRDHATKWQSVRANASDSNVVYSNIYEHFEQRMTLQFAATVE